MNKFSNPSHFVCAISTVVPLLYLSQYSSEHAQSVLLQRPVRATHTSPTTLLPTKEEPIKQVILLPITKVVMKAFPAQSQAKVHIVGLIHSAIQPDSASAYLLQEIYSLQIAKGHLGGG